jgi:hypothetical protein
MMDDEKDEMYLCVDYPWADYEEDIDGTITRRMNKLHHMGYKPFSIKEFPIRSRLDKVLAGYDDTSVKHDDVSVGNGDTFQHVRWTRIYYQRV